MGVLLGWWLSVRVCEVQFSAAVDSVNIHNISNGLKMNNHDIYTGTLIKFEIHIVHVTTTANFSPGSDCRQFSEGTEQSIHENVLMLLDSF